MLGWRWWAGAGLSWSVLVLVPKVAHSSLFFLSIVAKNYHLLPEIDKSCQKFSEKDTSCQKIATSCQKIATSCQNCQQLHKGIHLDPSGPIWTILEPSGPICTYLDHCSHVVPMGTLISFWVPIFIQGPHFHNFRLKNALKVRAATI